MPPFSFGSRALMILVIIISLPIVSILQLPPKVMAQAPSEQAKVLIDDVIQALKANHTEKAQVHLNILKQQLSTFVNSSSIQSVNVLIDDATSALKKNDVNNAVVHLNLIKQQLGSTALNVTRLNTSANNTSNRLSTYKNPTYGITSLQYPSDWTINETNFQVTNDSAGVVEFLPPEAKNSPPGQTPALVQIFIETPDDPQVVSNLSSYIRNEMMHMANSSYFSMISANTTAKLAGLPAFLIELKQLNFDNIWYQIEAIIAGKVLTVKYLADSPNFSKYLPAALKIIDSLKIDKSTIEQLFPIQGNVVRGSENNVNNETVSTENSALTPSEELTSTTHNQGHRSYWPILCSRYGDDSHLQLQCSLYGKQHNTAAVSSNFSFEIYPATFTGESKTYSNHGISLEYNTDNYVTVLVNNGILKGLNNTLLFDSLSINPNNPIPMTDLNITVFELKNEHDKALFNQTYGRELNPGGNDVVIGNGIHAYRTTKISYEPQSMVRYLYTFTDRNKGYVIGYTDSPGIGVSVADETLSSLKIQ